MAARLGMADAVGGAPSYVGRALRQLFSVFLGGATATRPLGATSGVRPGTPATIVTATSTTWTVTPFAGVIDLEAAAIAGPYEFAFDTNQSGVITAAGGTARVDILFVRVNDGSEGDGTLVAPFIEIGYLAGTAVAPATPARSFVLAQINVPASGGGAPTVTWLAPYAVAAGGIQPVPAGVYPASPFLGQYIDDAAAGLLRGNGTAIRRGTRARIGEYQKGASPGFVIASPAYTDTTPSVSVTATTLGGLVEVEFDAMATYAGVGINNLIIYYRLLCDGTPVGDESTQFLPPQSAGSVVRLTVSHTPTPGSHVWKIQMAASSATAAVLGKARLVVVENP
jgi:hypothetical protein